MAELIIKDGDIIVQVGALISVLGVNSKVTISNYVEKGMPFIKSGRQKAYGVKACIDWCYKNGYLKLDIDVDDDIDVEALPANIRKDLADARLKELKLKQMEEEVIEKSDVVKDATTVGLSLRDNLMSIPARLASTLANETNPREVKSAIEREIRHSLEDISSAFME